MPVRRRIAAAPREAQPDPTDRWTWASGDGCRPYAGWPGYRTEAAARKAWDRVGRVVVWTDCLIGCVPAAVRHYDGLAQQGHQAALYAFMFTNYDVAMVRAATARDRASVAAFRLAQPRAYQQIETFLSRFLVALDAFDEDAAALADSRPAER